MTNFVLTILVWNKGAYMHSRWRHVLAWKPKEGPGFRLFTRCEMGILTNIGKYFRK
jgi:hypothetical protein